MSDKAIIKRAVEHYGDRAQTIKAVEELAELQQELCKYLGGHCFAEHIAEEMADVEIMLEQLRLIFRNDEVVDHYRKMKLERLAVRMCQERKMVRRGQPGDKAVRED